MVTGRGALAANRTGASPGCFDGGVTITPPKVEATVVVMDSPQHVPATLRRQAQWIGWATEERDGKPTKVPVDPHTGGYASVADSATWSSFDAAYAAYREGAAVEGVGFVFTADDPYAGVDLDDCRNPKTGAIDEWAVEIIERLDSYAEVSPSGTGVHVIVEGTVPAGGNRSGNLEVYDRDRYFTVTGERLPSAPRSVEQRGEKLAVIHEEYIARTAPDADPVPEAERPEVELDDDELLERAREAANGEKFERLWRGDISGYDSHSEADQALCSLLAFWTGGDAQLIERLFNRSGLVRDKWRNRPDYRERTIRTAIEQSSSFYGPDA